MEEREVPAGRLSSWLAEVRPALRLAGQTDVPCGECTACCTSSQFVHIAPDEHDALAHVPRALRFPAPGLPKGHVVLGFDEHGHCPLLRDGRCSIYEHRPRTCRAYDCRVFAATGVEVDTAKPAIAARVARWRFEVESDEERRRLAALRAAAEHLRAHPEVLTSAGIPAQATQLAAVAIAMHEHFLDGADVTADEVADAVARWSRE